MYNNIIRNVTNNQQELYNVIFEDSDGKKQEKNRIPKWMLRYITAWCDENGGKVISYNKC